jgi:uncharacterized SAM-dependent methyltransferase
LERAYDDAKGVTARFNLNILERINRDLGGDFDISGGGFTHRAQYNEAEGRIEMYLVSEREQTVRVAALDRDFSFAKGEVIHTENSYKQSREELEGMAKAAGLRVEEQWLDSQGRFSETLFRIE